MHLDEGSLEAVCSSLCGSHSESAQHLGQGNKSGLCPVGWQFLGDVAQGTVGGLGARDDSSLPGHTGVHGSREGWAEDPAWLGTVL